MSETRDGVIGDAVGEGGLHGGTFHSFADQRTKSVAARLLTATNPVLILRSLDSVP